MRPHPHRLGAAGPAGRRHHRARRGAGRRRRAHRAAGRGRDLATTACAWPTSTCRLDEIGAAVGAVARRLDPEWPGLRQRRPGAALRRVLRRLAHARGAGRHAVQRSRPPDPRRAVEPSRPRGACSGSPSTCKRFRHTLLMVSHDRDLLNDVCDHIVHIDQREARHLHRQLRLLRAHARRAARANDAAQQAKIAAQRKHMQAFVDRFKAKASKARQAQSRIKMIEKLGPVVSVPIDEHVTFNFPLARAARLADRDARRGLGRLRRRPAGAAQARPAARHGRPHRAARPERQRQVDLHPAALGAARAARGQGEEARRKLRIGYFSQDQEESLDYEATPFDHMSQRPRARPPASPRCAPSSAASASRATAPTSRSACCRAARRRGCCWRSPRATRRTCCCSTSRPTISTWTRAPRWSRRSTTSRAPSCW